MWRAATIASILLVTGTVPGAAMTGREVIDQAQQRNGFSTWRDRSMTATMESYAGERLVRTREMDVQEQTDPRGEHRTFLVFVGPADVQGTRFLHLSPRGEPDQQWLWAPATRRTRRLGDAQRDENFFGSDLSYRDLELLVRIQQWNDREAEARLIGEEAIEGKPAYVVELVPRNTEFPYAKYRLWFDRSELLLWRVDVYGDESSVLKRVTLDRYQRLGSYQTAGEAVVANLRAGTRTVFRMRQVRYDVGLDPDRFAVSSLDRG